MATRKPADERREEIVAAALTLADAAGPDRLTTGTVAAAVGITQAGVFRHFPKKQDLWDAIGAEIGRRMKAAWAEPLDAATRPLQRLEGLVRAQLTLIQETPAIPAILFSHELHSENEALRLTFLGLMRTFVGHLVAIIEAGRADRSVRADLDAHDAALLVVAVMQGVIVRWSLTGRAFDLCAEAERLLTVTLRGLTPPEGEP